MTWVATTLRNETIGRYRRKPDMIRKVSLRLKVGDRFKAASTSGARVLYEVNAKPHGDATPIKL